MILYFYKYQGTGNDFIIIDDRNLNFDINNNQLINSLCERRLGIGADGLILLRDNNEYDFEMIYFNSDGFQSTMCGNGGRCIVDFARNLGIVSNETTFLAIDGIHQAKFLEDEISLKMKDVTEIRKIGKDFLIDTGSPHYIKMIDNLETLNIEKEARIIRCSPLLEDEGVNVNFVSNNSNINMRTYERGVEAETLSCGTGAIAVAIAMYYDKLTHESIVNINTNGGVLNVCFEEFNGIFRNIWLSGPVNMIYSGEFEC
tara:strand:+ start:4009 stop:4782 length:774 start_codon:yes stop_codon:yes gene_type:complete